MRRSRALTLLLLAVAAGPAPSAAQHALLLHGNDLVRVAAPGTGAAAAVAKVVAGPDAAERGAGLRSAVPPGTELVGVTVGAGRAEITLGAGFLAAVGRAHELELAIEQLAKSVFAVDARIDAVDLRVAGVDGIVRPLRDILAAREGAAAPRAERAPPLPPPAPDDPVQGALTGRTIVVSPGHGYYWHTTLGWTTQRGNIGGLIEDIHTGEIAMRYLIPHLENMGARVISCRERGEVLHERVADNDAGAPIYIETGAWSTSLSSGYQGGTYRFATTTAAATSTAAFAVPVAADGHYPCYAFFRAGANRSADARYEVHHSGGVDEVVVDQRRDDRTWVFLGQFHFEAARGAQIVLTDRSQSPGGVVIADAVKVGAGTGSIVRGAGPSGRPRWQECSRYWAQYAGAPQSVWDSISGGQDNDDDVTCRPRYAEWRGADAFLSLHTNAGGGAGTDSFIYNGGATAGSDVLQSRVQSQVVSDLRTFWDPAWVDRGTKQANFGEVRLLSTMPGVLVELAFHDTPGSKDHEALHDPRFRRIAGRALARGVMRFFQAAAAFPPEPPDVFWVTQDGAAGLRVAWDPVAGAVSYTVEQSQNGKGFVEAARVTGTSWSTGPLPHGASLSFRVRAWNASGRSWPTEVLTAGTSHRRTADLLLVQGFERLEKTVKYPDNTFDYLARHGAAIRRADEFSLGFDAATNDAVVFGRVRLSSYRAVDWACGEESTRHESFNGVEQSLVRSYLAAGGRLLVSGSEIGWDLDANGSTADRDFYRNVLGARYVADDAGTYGFLPSAGSTGVFSGLASGTFDDGKQGTYDVDYPDVIAPADAKSVQDLVYATGVGAGIERVDGSSRVVHLGFPLETIVGDELRAQVMARALRFLLAPRGLEAPATIPIGTTVPLEVYSPAFAGKGYVLAASLSTSPPIPLPGGLLPLAPDGLFTASLQPQSPVFQRFQGLLDGNGRATAALFVPQIPALRGFALYFSGFTLASSTTPVLGEVLPWVKITIR